MTKLTEIQKEIIRDAGNVTLPFDDLALLLDMSIEELNKEMKDKNSEIYLLYNKGNLMALFEIEQTFIRKARGGDRLAAEFVLKIRDERKQAALRMKLFGV